MYGKVLKLDNYSKISYDEVVRKIITAVHETSFVDSVLAS